LPHDVMRNDGQDPSWLGLGSGEFER
jgi:hypothetical protein